MKNMGLFWIGICFNVALLCTSIGMLVSAQATGGYVPASRAATSTSAPATRPDLTMSPDELANEYLDFETARLALVAMVERSKDPTLKTALPYLSKPAERGDETYYDFRVGNAWEIFLKSRTWIVPVDPANYSSWTYYGEFFRDKDGRWAARVGSKTRSMRGGR